MWIVISCEINFMENFYRYIGIIRSDIGLIVFACELVNYFPVM